MSTTTYLVCDTCRQSIWVGQSVNFYSGEPKMLQALRLFLYDHKQSTLHPQDDDQVHALRFTHDHDEVLDGGDSDELGYDEKKYAWSSPSWKEPE